MPKENEQIVNNLTTGQKFHLVAKLYREFKNRKTFDMLNRIVKNKITYKDKIVIFTLLKQ